MACPRIRVKRDVLAVRSKELLEVLHDGRRFKFVLLSKMAEEGRFCLGVADLRRSRRPVEQNDCGEIPRELLREPEAPICTHGESDDPETVAADVRVILKAP